MASLTKVDRLWTAKEVARYLQVSTRWLQDSDVPRLRLGGKGTRQCVRYMPQAVKEWVRKQHGR